MASNISQLITSVRDRDIEKQEVGIGGFVLLARVRDSFTLSSRAPDAFLEDGSSASDQIVNDPLTLIIEGEVSDIHIRRNPALELQRRVASQVGAITKYAPLRTQSQISRVSALINDAADAVRKIDAIIDDGRNAWEFFGNKDTDSKGLREQFIDFIESIHYGKQLINIDMPFRTHESMRITSIVVNADNIDEPFSFVINAKKIRFASTEVTDITDYFPAASNGIGGQEQQQKDKGAQKGEETSESLLSYLKGLF